MTYRGTVRNGVVVFRGARRPTEGTAVEVRPLAAKGAAKALAPQNGTKTSKPTRGTKAGGRATGRHGPSVDQIAREQGATRAVPFDELLGGWPQGEEHDGFEEAVDRWRAEEPRRGEF
jgi:hypothetical protein